MTKQSPAESDAEKGTEKHRHKDESSAKTETANDLDANVVHSEYSTPRSLTIEAIREAWAKAAPKSWQCMLDDPARVATKGMIFSLSPGDMTALMSAPEHIAFLLAAVERRGRVAEALVEIGDENLAAARKRIAELERLRFMCVTCGANIEDDHECKV